jgi:ABC-type transport system substrate-binding protein
VDTDGNHLNGYQKGWEGEGSLPNSPASDPLRVAVQYTLNEPFALFYDSTLFPVMLPMHVWSRTGGGRHLDFGCAIWLPPAEASARGIPECGNTDPLTWGHGIASTETVTGSTPYQYTRAEGWNVVNNADVIGNGPFKFDSWVQGVEAKVVRFENYYTGANPSDPLNPWDGRLAQVLVKPTIEAIRYKVYKTTQLGVFALQSNEIDFYHWNVGAEFVPDLIKNPAIAVESNPEPGFFYMSYNLRLQPWGYVGGDPSQDAGYWLRQAISHLIDKKSIVQNLLQNFGVIGHGTVSPANTFWYNDGIPKPEFDLVQANAILDDLATPGGIYDPDFTLKPNGAAPCNKDAPQNCRSLPRIANGMFEILTPQADYDPVRASAGAMVADAMRQAGLNAVSRPTAFGEIVSRIAVHDFDVFILGWRITGTDPDYLFSFFDSSNAATGQNYPGFNNVQFDTAIRASRAELDRTTRRGYIFQAQQILADQRPYDVLYFRTNIEGYRQDRYVNWTVSSGTIWGFWSLQGIRPPSTKLLRLVLSAPSATSSAASETITATVFDDANQALVGASVEISVDQSTVTIGTCVNQPSCTGITNVEGKVSATFTAPTVTTETTVIIQATATHADFPDPSSRNTVIRVFAAGTSFLSVSLDLLLGDRATAGSSIPMGVTVRDQDRVPVGDAGVTILSSDAAKLSPSPSSGTATQVAQVTLSASATVTTETSFTVSVTATKLGYADGTQDVDVTVAPASSGGYKICPDGSRIPVAQTCRQVSTPGLEVLPILAGIGVAALVAGVIAERKRRS